MAEGASDGNGIRMVSGQRPQRAMKSFKEPSRLIALISGAENGRAGDEIMPTARTENQEAENVIMPVPWVRKEVMDEGAR